MREARLIYDVPVTESRYLRYPNLRGDLLTFVADDDVWLAPADGGRAWRISADRVQAAGPKFSGDGSLVAWTSWRDGPPEIYLASYRWRRHRPGQLLVEPEHEAARLEPRRGDPRHDRGEPAFHTHYTWAYAIPVSDGAGQFAEHRRLPYGPVGDIAIDAASIALLTLQLSGSRVLEAVPRRHLGPAVGRRPGCGRFATGVPPAARRPARPVLQPDAGRRQARVPQRLRGHRQRLLVRAGRHRPAPPHRSRRNLRAQREHRRHQHRLPERRRHLADPRPQRGQRAGQAGRHAGRARCPAGPRSWSRPTITSTASAATRPARRAPFRCAAPCTG